MLAKLICTAILGAVIFISFFKPVYHVNAPFALAANERRYVAAPFEGQIYKVYVNPGEHVKKGAKLFELNTVELKKQLTEAWGRKNEAEKEWQKYKFDGATLRGQKPAQEAEAAVALAKSQSAQAEMDVIQQKIDNALVKSDIDGEVLDMGELKYKINAPVKLGDQLMIVGQTTNLYAELRVPERDIQDVREGMLPENGGGLGSLAVSSAPTEKIPFKIERIVPMTEAKEGETYYKVFVQLDPTSKDWKPEYNKLTTKWLPLMEGESRIDVGQRRLAWIWTHRFIDWVRLHLWSNPVFAPFFK
jgi:multidrug efflux pump subunit AcrA (membrane-fusion protein)